jgi:hypothetical protein
VATRRYERAMTFSGPGRNIEQCNTGVQHGSEDGESYDPIELRMYPKEAVLRMDEKASFWELASIVLYCPIRFGSLKFYVHCQFPPHHVY